MRWERNNLIHLAVYHKNGLIDVEFKIFEYLVSFKSKVQVNLFFYIRRLRACDVDKKRCFIILIEWISGSDGNLIDTDILSVRCISSETIGVPIKLKF